MWAQVFQPKGAGAILYNSVWSVSSGLGCEEHQSSASPACKKQGEGAEGESKPECELRFVMRGRVQGNTNVYSVDADTVLYTKVKRTMWRLDKDDKGNEMCLGTM